MTGTAARVRDAIRASLADGVTRGAFPGAVAAVAQGRATLALEAVGLRQILPRRWPAAVRTIFDLASVTKPVATTTAVLQLWARGVIDLDVPVSAYLPAFAAGGKVRATVRHLLTHTAGLPAWEMLFLPRPAGATGPRAGACRTIAQAVARICATPVEVPPGRRVEYSDLGFVVLGHLVERLSGEPLERYARQRIFAPLRMHRTRWRPPSSWRSRCAATELGNVYERTKAAAQGLGARFHWRAQLIRGEVHDGNAWYVGRGLAGHAGLFGTADDLIRFGRAILGPGKAGATQILPREIVAEATRNQTAGLGHEPRGLGWAMKGWSFIGGRASAAAFGHTGFTGTSIVLDPERDLAVVLLTNRVHPRADSTAIQQFRPEFHDTVIEALDG